ncbi:MAG: DNA polymerase III subunit beta, partial [Candidatus Saccharibacteria bacterium]|nr:DNA polymerase III subunit beta [Candidatus Saccharibacteria bacterium]
GGERDGMWYNGGKCWVERRKMEIEVQQDKMAKALNLVSRVAMGAKSTLPILANVLIRADEGKVSLMATNLDMGIVEYVPVVSAKNGVITVPARIISEFVGNLPRGETVKMSLSGETLEISAGRYRSKINGAIADDFPEMPVVDEKDAVIYKVPVEQFKLGMSEVIFAASGDTTRPMLTGICFSTNEGALYVAGTDGYRLAERKFIEGVKSDVKAVVPRATLQEVLRSFSDEMEEVEIVFTETQVRFRMGEVEVVSKLIDGSYPDYRGLIPKNLEVEVVAEKVELARMVKMAMVFARETNGAVECRAVKEDQKLIVSSLANEAGENSSEMNVETDGDAEMKLMSKYMAEAINAIEEGKVRIMMSEKKGQAMVMKNEKSDDYVHLLMPLS